MSLGRTELDRHATTKCFIDKAADLDMYSSMFFEGGPQRGTDQTGILAFADPNYGPSGTRAATSGRTAKP